MPGAVALGAKTRQLRNIGLRRAGELLVEALGLWSLAHFTLGWASAFARLARLRDGLGYRLFGHLDGRRIAADMADELGFCVCEHDALMHPLCEFALRKLFKSAGKSGPLPQKTHALSQHVTPTAPMPLRHAIQPSRCSSIGIKSNPLKRVKFYDMTKVALKITEFSH